MKITAWKVSENDNTAVVTEDVQQGAEVTAGGLAVTARDAIPRGHKIALGDIPAGEAVCKYGVPIGRASAAIRAGDHVHTHNVEDNTAQLCAGYYKAYMAGEGVR